MDKHEAERRGTMDGKAAAKAGWAETVKVQDIDGRPRCIEVNAAEDFTLNNHGTILVLEARSDAAKAWVAEHLPDDALTWGKDGTVIEHRYIGEILDGIVSDGLIVKEV